MFWKLTTESNLQKTYCLDISEAEQLLVCSTPFASYLDGRCPYGIQP